MSSSQSSAPHIVSRIVSHLGGPPITPTDIEWALDFSAGKALIEWVADQFRIANGEVEDVEEGMDSLRYRSAFESIALEDEEVQMLKRIGELQLVRPPNEHDIDPSSFSKGYVLPSKTRAYTACIEKESTLLENETAHLKQRLSQTKLANHKLVQLIRSLQSAIDLTDNETRQSKDRLAELSITADMAVSRSVDSAIQEIERHRPDSDINLVMSPCRMRNRRIYSKTWNASMSSLSAFRSRLVAFSEFQICGINERAASLPDIDEIQNGARRLNRVFNSTAEPANGISNMTTNHANEKRDDNIGSRSVYETAREIVFGEELDKMCKMLDGGTPVNDLLEGLAAVPTDMDFGDIDVNGELERAWALDHGSILAAKGEILSDTLNAFKTQLIPTLTELYETLTKADHQVREVEAVVGALGEELEELIDDIQSSGPRHSNLGSTASVEEPVLEDELMALFKRRRGMRAIEAPPLVILDRTDVLAEIRTLMTRLEMLENSECELVNNLSKTLDATSSLHADLLSQIYKHSPMNTSPPFMPPIDQCRLEDDTGKKANELKDVLENLQEESEKVQKTRVKHRLNVFVNK